MILSITRAIVLSRSKSKRTGLHKSAITLLLVLVSRLQNRNRSTTSRTTSTINIITAQSAIRASFVSRIAKIPKILFPLLIIVGLALGVNASDLAPAGTIQSCSADDCSPGPALNIGALEVRTFC
jgi:hypothetical protein